MGVFGEPLVKWKWCKCRGLWLHSMNVVILLNKLTNSDVTLHSAPGPPRIIFLDSTSITKKFRYSLEKLPGSWNFCFFYFEHCVLAISKLHLPTCLTKIGEFHSIKCLFWTPIFFMITVFHTMAINIFFLEIYGIFWKSRSF